jgi:hypothetical protein
LAPSRLARLEVQHAADAKALGVSELLDQLVAATLLDQTDALTRRIAYRTVVTLAQTARRAETAPEVAILLDQRVHDIADALSHRRGDATERSWAASLSRQLLDAQQMDKLLADRPRTIDVPPGDPIGGEDDWMATP